MIKYLFADRDGTLIYDKHYLSDPQQVELLPNVANALQKINAQGIQIIIVSNQSGIGRKYFEEKDFLACQKELYRQLASYNISILDTAYCPHSPEEHCTCRKPSLGMWYAMQKKYAINPKECAMIGDKKEDVLFGIQAGFSYSCLVQTGKGKKTIEELALPITNTLQEIAPSYFSSHKTDGKCLISPNFENFAQYLTK